MGTFFFLILRRMRAPLIFLILIYGFSILGLTLIPGINEHGHPTPPLSFFHAFYFISYTATTIGFGEVPQAFSNGQRLWVILCIYLSVIGWTYTILTILSLVQDSGFQNALLAARFAWRVKRMGETFYLVCGCGETGRLVGRTLDRIGRRFVVVESNRQRVEELDLEDFKTDTPALSLNAALPESLLLAGLKHPRCQGVLALTNSDDTNLSIAITVRLLNPSIPVLARAEKLSITENLASFGTDHIINPFEHFADYLALAIRSPSCYQLLDCLTGIPGKELPSPLPLPPVGHWIICGYGRFGQAVARRLDHEGMNYSVIDPRQSSQHGKLHVVSAGTEAEPLQAAGIDQAIGIVAGTENDVTNLSIAMTAKQINPKLFIVMRQNQIANSVLFEAFNADINMVSSRIVAHECLARLSTPLLGHFLTLAQAAGEEWAARLNTEITTRLGQYVPEVWNVRLNAQEARAVHRALVLHGQDIRLADLLRSPSQEEEIRELIPLLLSRDDELFLLPDPHMLLKPGDWLLFTGTSRARSEQDLTLFSEKALHYILTGKDPMEGWVWRKIHALMTKKASAH